MPKISKEFQEEIKKIPIGEIQKLVIELARKSQEVYDLVDVRFINRQDADTDLFNETKEDIAFEMEFIGSRGVIQKQIARSIAKSVEGINHYAKVTKNKVKEAELLLYLLEIAYKLHDVELGTCWTVFDSKLAITTNRLLTLVSKNLHEDYFIEYQEPLNRVLRILHAKCNHLDYVYNLPKQAER
ncbi:MAG: hypothetical protein NTX61_03760 [Bacteroidetes bacterium]|nr:hypothetical protein [Bacteroidota bacterium]